MPAEWDISEGGPHNWVRQDRGDRGERHGFTTPESIGLANARKRIRQLEMEVEILKRPAKLLGEERLDPKRSGSLTGALAGAGFPAKVWCRPLGVSSPGYRKYRNRPLPAMADRAYPKEMWIADITEHPTAWIPAAVATPM